MRVDWLCVCLLAAAVAHSGVRTPHAVYSNCPVHQAIVLAYAAIEFIHETVRIEQCATGMRIHTCIASSAAFTVSHIACSRSLYPFCVAYAVVLLL